MKLFVAFLMMALVSGAARAQDVMSATSEDLQEFDRLLEKSEAKKPNAIGKAAVAKSAAGRSSSPRERFNAPSDAANSKNDSKLRSQNANLPEGPLGPEPLGGGGPGPGGRNDGPQHPPALDGGGAKIGGGSNGGGVSPQPPGHH